MNLNSIILPFVGLFLVFSLLAGCLNDPKGVQLVTPEDKEDVSRIPDTSDTSTFPDVQEPQDTASGEDGGREDGGREDVSEPSDAEADSCVPRVCGESACGAMDDGCGQPLECGPCTEPAECVENVCKCRGESDLELCEKHHYTCGSVTLIDSCGEPREADCGGCDEDTAVCHHNQCCQPTNSCDDTDQRCEEISDGCGNTILCDNCTHLSGTYPSTAAPEVYCRQNEACIKPKLQEERAYTCSADGSCDYDVTNYDYGDEVCSMCITGCDSTTGQCADTTCSDSCTRNEDCGSVNCPNSSPQCINRCCECCTSGDCGSDS